jgi:zinc protease
MHPPSRSRQSIRRGGIPRPARTIHSAANPEDFVHHAPATVSTPPLRPFSIASETRVLGNGMRIVVHENHNVPLLAVHLMLHVGSKDEAPGQTGLAHLLEHLLFEGSENCPKGQFDLLLEEVGGSHNGSTWLDRTNYFETVPTHAAELPLWLERERLAHFLPILDPEMLELQRGVVLNERLQTVENRPYGRADERLHQLLFSPDHPYSWPTIGYQRDLETISLDHVRSFLLDHYTPVNAVLVLAGDLPPTRAFDLADRYFGDLEPGPPRPGVPRPVLVPETERLRETLLDRVSFPRVYRAAVTPPYGTDDWIALDVLAYLLADGESSRLQRRLIREREIAQEVESYLLPTELNGVFGIVATARSGIGAEVLEDEVEAELMRVADDPPSEDEVSAAVRRLRRDQLAGLATLEDRADALAYATTVLGDAARLNSVIEGYLAVGPEDVQRVAREHLTGGRIATVEVLAAGEAADEER